MEVGTRDDIYLSVPRSAMQSIKAKYVIDRQDLEAPLKQGEKVGTIQVLDKDNVLASYPLMTLNKVDEGGLVTKIGDYLKQKF